jgi:small subunit ribosomal protein S16
MAVVIRMKRAGAKGRPFFRVVVADSRYPRDGRYIEQLGYYDPLTDPATFNVDEGKFEHWIRRGARPSESVEVMMKAHAPQALRPAPLPSAAPEATAAAPAAPERPRAVKPKAAPKKPRAPRRGSDKKAKARTKAKAGPKRKSAAGASKTKAAKKTKK